MVQSKVAINARRLAGGGFREVARLQKRGLDARLEPRVAGEPEDIVHAILFAPSHQRFAREARVGTQDYLHLGPARADLLDDTIHLLDRASARVDVRALQLCRQQMPAAKHVKRQVAVAATVAVKEAALLVAVHRIVGGVEIEHNLARRLGVDVEKQIDKQLLDRRAVMADLVIARLLAFRPTGSTHFLTGILCKQAAG